MLEASSPLPTSCGMDSLDRLTRTVGRILNVSHCGIAVADARAFGLTVNDGSCVSQINDRQQSPLCSYVMNHAIEDRVVVFPDVCDEPRLQRLLARRPKGSFSESTRIVRFFAGVAMLNPDGVRVAVFYVSCAQPRARGLTKSERQTFTDLAAAAADIFTDRRDTMEMRSKQALALAHTAHDLMTPLTGMQLCVGLLEEDKELDSKLNEHQLELFSTVTRCSSAVASICKESIDTLREESVCPNFLAKSMEDKKGSFCKLDDLAQSLHRVMFPLPKRVPLIIELDPSTPLRLNCDGVKVFRAALNLLSTACARTTEGCVRLRILCRGDRLCFECEDSAPALSTEDRNNVLHSREPEDFEDVFLAEYHFPAVILSSIQDDAQYGVRRVGDAPSGSIFWFSVANPPQTSSDTVSSVDTNSTTISTSSSENTLEKQGRIQRQCMQIDEPLALVEDRMSRKRAASNNDLPGEGKRVLIIDDSIVLRKSLQRSLTNLGYSVTLAENGLSGLKLLQCDTYAFCLCDFLMPVMDGLDMVRQLREWESVHRPNWRQYVVGISAHAAENDSLKGMEAGMDNFLSKPITKACLQSLQVADNATKWVSPLTPHSDHRRVSSNAVRKLEDGHHNRMISNVEDNSGSSSESSDSSSFDLRDSPASSVSGSKHVVSTKQHCLVISSDAPDLSSCTASLLASRGWICQHATETNEAVQLLKTRNWDCVLVGGCRGDLSGVAAVVSFRDWETSNRFNRQNNVILEYMSDEREENLHRQGELLVQAPTGFDGTLCTPVAWDDFADLMEKSRNEMNIIVH